MFLFNRSVPVKDGIRLTKHFAGNLNKYYIINIMLSNKTFYKGGHLERLPLYG